MQQVIGQNNLLSEIDRIFEIYKGSDANIRPHFFLTGQSGTGKTMTIKAQCVKHNIAMMEINAAQLTKEGTSGNSLSKALSPLIQLTGKLTIVFVDEFDKLFISGNSNDSVAHETTLGVQNEFLKVLESDTASVYGDYGKYVNVQAGKVLFIFAGAFNGEENIDIDRMREMGVKTEFLGRVGLIYNTSKLTIEDIYSILDNSELLSMYLKLFPKEDKEKVTYAIKAYLRDNFEFNTLGARLVNTLINQYFIKGGKLGTKEIKELSFQHALEL